MIDTNRKQEMSISYLNAVCAVGGISMERQVHDDDSIDVILKKVIRRADSNRYNAQISVQLKATSRRYAEYTDHYTYPLKKKNYDDLRMESTLKSFLFILILPENENEWVEQSIEQLIVRKCMFWIDLKELPISDNTSTVTVHIPKTQIVSQQSLDEIMRDVAEGEF